VWVFDLDAASAAALPRGATALLERRLAELAPATRRVLEAAAIHGRSWDTALLADLFGIGIADIGFAANDARRARLVETDASGAVRFVHDCVREALVDGLTEDARRELHQRCAEGLDRRGVVAFETLCVMAGHYAQGIATRTPDRAYHAHRTAADLALARAANEAAVGFLDVARTFAEAARLPLDAAFFEALGEAHLRTGALEASREAFQDALRRAAGAFHRARLFGRLAWVEQARSDATAAWTALSTAFDLLGASLPVESVSSAWGTTRALVLSRLATRGRPRSAEEAELLCQLHYQNGRLGVEYGRPARALQSMLAALVVSEPLGDAPPRARARATEGLLLTVLGRTEAGSRAVDDAHRIATELADPSLLAFCALSRATALTIAGELDAASDAIAECLRDRGHWIELGEYGLLAFTGDLIESVRGRSERALAFAQLALDRVRRRRRPDGIAPLAALRARAALAALGKDYEPDPWTDELLARSDRASWRKGIVGALSIAPRLRLVLEAGRTGDELEALVAELRQQARGPHRSAPALVEAFLYVVHARVDASFGAPASARASHAALVREATAELRDRARQPVMVAHIRFAEGHAAWLLGKRAESARLFAEAERIAVEDGIPWVLHAVARTRAHDLLARGARGAAAEQGRIAESIARAHGALPKARRVAHELGLGSHGARGTSAAHETSSSLSSETGRQLRSMVNLARSTRRSASLRDQAALVADEVLRLLDGERCCLLFHPERHAGGSGLCVAVDAALGASEPTVHERLRLEAATGVPAPREFGAQRGGPGGRVLVAPLFLFDQLVGAVSVELPPGAAASERAAGVLVAVAGQLPVALELARLLAEREQLQASLLQAQRMEAVGQLAGGIAHDFNNMLSAIVGSAESLSDHVNGHPEAMEELGVITTASMRAADLTKQLLSFSRHKPLPLKCLDANALVTSLVPMLQRIVGDRIEISVRLDATSYEVKSDASGLEQALVNLATNARDAMKREGKLLVRTRDVVLDDAASRRGAPAPGAYVAIDVVDAGEGMPRDVLERVFDPFFTTKPPGAGTGLGLTMVYTFVARSAGHVQLDSTPGAGTTVTLLLPRFEGPDEPVPAEPPSIPAIPRLGGPPRATILVVDDDVVVRASIKRTLQREGYVVIAAEGARDAERTLASHVDEIALVVLDVVMPDDSGPTLARRWKKELARPPKVLFVSGFSPETLPTPENGQVGARFLQKPFSGAELLARVTQLLGAGANAE
jgi:signal transduction histidine kinase/tetratricopeptide (TPR) repeat protein